MPPIDRTQLRERWTALCRRLNLSNRDDVFEMLLGRYTGPDRHYHDIQHIAASLRELDAARPQCESPDAVEMAIWFHDCVYDAYRLDNEEQSARIARQHLAEMGADPPFIDRVCDLILATRHDRPPSTQDQRLLVDIDLLPLGAPADVFDHNGILIRQEYSHLDDATYSRGRAEILQRFLSRPRIYATDLFANRYEAQARMNLTRTIAQSA